MNFTGKPTPGWVTGGGPALAEDQVLDQWITTAVGFASTLPPR
ncbi:hypothetical protein [Streptomyces erythrochromogenes]|nr:hypothetical protein OG364_06540 [Streptomyces erythrochromogenes]